MFKGVRLIYMIRILEALYLIYMFCFFETSVDFNVLSSPDHRFFKHLIGNKKGNRICPFGHVAIFLLAAVLLFGSSSLIKCSLVIAFIFSLMNLNAVVYLMPVFLLEFFNLKLRDIQNYLQKTYNTMSIFLENSY